MKRKNIFLVLLLISPIFMRANLQKSLEEAPQIYAVIVGISNYSDPNITALRYAHQDAESYRNFLLSPGGGSVPTRNIVLLTNEKATRSAIIGALRTTFQTATAADVIIFYYAGHGIPDPKVARELFFATYDTEKRNYVGTALLKGQVETEFTTSPAKLKLFLADACHSGGTGIYLGTRDDGSELVNRLTININSVKEPSWAALTAASSAEQSIEDVKWGGGHGVFTYYLIKGLQGEADKSSKKNPKAKGDGNGIVTVREIYDYLNNIIPSETNGSQHPDKQGLNEDVFPVSAVTPDLYAGAVTKYIKPSPASQPLLTDKNALAELKTNNAPATIVMPPGNCNDGNYTYGELILVNNYSEDVLLYHILNHQGGFPLNILLAKGEKTTTGRLTTGFVSPLTGFRDVKLYFKTIDESKPIRYGAVTFNIETCKIKTEILTTKNLYLSLDGEKR